MTLFLRIFLFFWLTAALLASSFFVLGRMSGTEVIEQANLLLKTQADIVATLWQRDGHRATRQWLFQQSSQNRPILLNAQGQSPFPVQSRRHKKPLPKRITLPLKEGIQHQKFGHVTLIVALPDIQPPLFLVKPLNPGQLHRFPFWVGLLAAIFIISMISYLLAYLLSQRIQKLRHAVQDIARGNLTRRVTISGKDEVSALAIDFNHMADRINDMLDSQRQLVSDVSHELRSPLARLRIALELAQHSKTSELDFTRIEKEADELETIVSELLSLARLESNQFELEKQSIDINAILTKIVRDAQFEGAASKRTVNFNNDDKITIQGDPILIHAAIENVVRNALRHSPPSSITKITTQHEADKYIIYIDDQGPGVPDESLQSIFKPFARVAKSRDRQSGGFGLGLAITGKTMQAHGGQVSAENLTTGGLRVTLVFSLKSTPDS